MSLFGWIKSVAGFAVPLIKALTGSEKPKVTDLIPVAMANLWQQAQLALAYGKLSSKEQIDDWCAMIDASTGSDPNAIEVIPNMNAADEEKFFDDAVRALKRWLYCHNGIPTDSLE